MDILLVNPDHGDQNNFPWGCLAVGSYLKNVKNYEVEVLDASVDGEELALETIKQKLNKTKVVGFTSFSSDIPLISDGCCVEITIVSIALGRSFSYKTLTWVLPSGSR